MRATATLLHRGAPEVLARHASRGCRSGPTLLRASTDAARAAWAASPATWLAAAIRPPSLPHWAPPRRPTAPALAMAEVGRRARAPSSLTKRKSGLASRFGHSRVRCDPARRGATSSETLLMKFRWADGRRRICPATTELGRRGRTTRLKKGKAAATVWWDGRVGNLGELGSSVPPAHQNTPYPRLCRTT